MHAIRIKPFSTLECILIAPAPAEQMVAALGLRVNLATGTISGKKQTALLAAAHSLVGNRKPRESGAEWTAKAQSALDARFPS